MLLCLMNGRRVFGVFRLVSRCDRLWGKCCVFWVVYLECGTLMVDDESGKVKMKMKVKVKMNVK